MFSAGGSTPGAGAASLGPPEQGWGSAGVSLPPFPPQTLPRAGMSLERADFPLGSESPNQQLPKQLDLGSGKPQRLGGGVGGGSSFLLALPPASFTITSKIKPNTFPTFPPRHTALGWGCSPQQGQDTPSLGMRFPGIPVWTRGGCRSCLWAKHPNWDWMDLGLSGGGQPFGRG